MSGSGVTPEPKKDVLDTTEARARLERERLLLDLLSYVPGWVVMRQSEVDRLLNEATALRIERDDARAEVERLGGQA